MVSRPGTWLFITTCFLAQQVDLCFQLHSLERSVGWWVFWGFFCLWVSSLQLVCRSLLVNCHVPAAEIWGVFKKASPFFFLWFTLKAQQSCKCCRKICGNRQRRCPSPASALGHSHRHTRTYTSSFAKVEKMV